MLNWKSSSAIALLSGLSALGILGATASAQNLVHTVVISGKNTSGNSEYTIQASGRVEKVKGQLNGHSVSIGDDKINGNRVNGKVWNGADGYRIFGSISKLELANPEAAQIYIDSRQASNSSNNTSSQNNNANGQCQKQIVAQSIEVLNGQGVGEGKLEMQVNVSSGNKSDQDRATVAPGQSSQLNTRLGSFYVNQGSSKTQNLWTKIREEEIGRDSFIGGDDFGETNREVTLQCGQTQSFTEEITISGKKDAKVRVHYGVQDTFQTAN